MTQWNVLHPSSIYICSQGLNSKTRLYLTWTTLTEQLHVCLSNTARSVISPKFLMAQRYWHSWHLLVTSLIFVGAPSLIVIHGLWIVFNTGPKCLNWCIFLVIWLEIRNFFAVLDDTVSLLLNNITTSADEDDHVVSFKAPEVWTDLVVLLLPGSRMIFQS